MNVRSNNIKDSFPCMLLSTLGDLVLRSNKFYGEVRCYKSWPNLQIIDIAYNNFSGNLYPESFSSWGGMMLESDAQLRYNRSGSLFLSPSRSYQDEVTLTIKGVGLKLVKIWPDFTSIDFSSNNFNETIPDALGDLTALYLLNLSHNALTGTIPKSLGKLRQLGSLDLSMNQLTGLIPVELGRLTSISVMNLSYNKLVGEIPNGRQIQTFSPTFFEGNTGLCGLPLNIRCNNTDENDPSPLKPEIVQSHGKMEIEWEYVYAALGYVVGLGSIAWILLCFQSLRTRYFEKVDEVLEKIFSCHDSLLICMLIDAVCTFWSHFINLHLGILNIANSLMIFPRMLLLSTLFKFCIEHSYGPEIRIECRRYITSHPKMSKLHILQLKKISHL